MATVSVSDAVVVPQARGTGLASESDPIDAAAVSLLASNWNTDEYVGSGMDFTRNDANDEIDIGPGYCFIRDDSTSTGGSRGAGGNPQLQSTLSSGYDTEIPDDQLYAVIFPSTVSVPVTDNTATTIWVNITDVTTNNAVEVRSSSGAGTTTAPTETFIELGEVNDSGTGDPISRPNDGFTITNADLENDSVTIAGNLVALGAATSIAHADISTVGPSDHHQEPTAGGGVTDEGTNQFGLDSVANGDATLSSGTVVVDTGHPIDDTAEYTAMLNPDEGADIAASLQEGSTNYQLHLEENTTSVGNPTCRWRLLRYN